MPYKPTGNPPGRPRKAVPLEGMPGIASVESSGNVALVETETAEPQRLTRAREGFRRTFPDPAETLHRPPRYGERRREVGKRPILHPNVIKG